MPRRVPIPPELAHTAFRTSDIEHSSLRRGRLRGAGVQHPFHGVSSIDLDLDSVRGRCAAFEPNLLPGQVFSHTTALALWGAPLPAVPRSLHLSVVFPRTPPRGRGVVGHSLRFTDPRVRDGLPVSSPSTAWCQSAVLLGLDDLVAAGDGLVTGPRRAGERLPGMVAVDELARAVGNWSRRPGFRKLRSALELVRSGVDSRRETFVRLLLVRAGLPEPVVDMPVEVAGGLVLHSDLGYPDLRLAIEYEGDGHRTSRRAWERDILRRELMEDAGVGVIRVTSEQLARPVALVRRIARRIAASTP